MMKDQNLYMQRCFDLAKLGKTGASPNPIVGAVLVHNDKIIGEGYHRRYGSSHAEVNAVNAVNAANKKFIDSSSLFVSLEPCNIVGNTPACTSLIIDQNIKKVHVSVIDKTEGVNNTGIEKLKRHKIAVETGIETSQGNKIANQRNTFVTKKRPYIILKWAESADGFLGQKGKQVWLTNPFSKRLVHKWRAETDSILVGTNTVLFDDPKLTTRLYLGSSPLRVIIDKKLKINPGSNVLNQEANTWVFNGEKNETFGSIQYIKIGSTNDYIKVILQKLYEAKKASLMVEGGAQLLNSFIALGLWDEIRCFKTKTFLQNGIKAPTLYLSPDQKLNLKNDHLTIYFNKYSKTLD